MIVVFIFSVIGCILSVFGIFIDVVEEKPWGILFFAAMLVVNVFFGINNGIKILENENDKVPTIEDVNTGKAHIDTTYTIHKGLTDTTYQIVWNKQ